MKLWYLAHPVSPDEKYTFKQNMKHVLKIARICFDAGFLVLFPWYEMCLFLDNEDMTHRKRGLEIDCETIRRLDGLILTGHKMSSGMRIEFDAASRYDKPILHAVTVPDAGLTEWLLSRASR